MVIHLCTCSHATWLPGQQPASSTSLLF